MKLLRTFHVGNIDITESSRPNEVTITLNTQQIILTKDEFRALCELGNSYRTDSIRFQPQDPMDEL